MQKVRAVFVDGLIPALSDGIPGDELPARGGLIASQLLGLAFARFMFAINQTAAIRDAQIIHLVGETIQRYLTGAI